MADPSGQDPRGRPRPPLLVIRTGRAFWVETRPTETWSATLQALREGCYADAYCHDAAGGCWAIIDAAPARRPSLAERWLPWRQVPVIIGLGPRTDVAVEDVASRLAAVLTSGNAFAESLDDPPAPWLGRFASARTHAELIALATACTR